MSICCVKGTRGVEARIEWAMRAGAWDWGSVLVSGISFSGGGNEEASIDTPLRGRGHTLGRSR